MKEISDFSTSVMWRNLKVLHIVMHEKLKGADLFQKGGQTKKQAAGRSTSRYSIGIKS